MRFTAWSQFAVFSAAAICAAATRPHYGGTLRVEMRAAPASLDPASADGARLAALVSDPLIRLDANGVPQPGAAISWQHDAPAKRWQFTLRPGLNATDVASALEPLLPGTTITGVTDSIVIRSDHAMPELLVDIAGQPVVTPGPFRLAAFEPGRRAVFAANPDYWGGRPFLDSVEVQFGRALRDQLVDLEVGKADVIEIAPTDIRRLSTHGRSLWTSAFTNLAVLSFAPRHAEDPGLRAALAMAIDRTAIYNVLLQKQGEITAALLPQWLSGYAFVFPTAPDLPRARASVNGIAPAGRSLTLSYDPSVSWARTVAERVAVNARDVGITLQVSPRNAQADLRLMEIRVPSLDPAKTLAEIAARLGLQAPVSVSNVAALYESERKLLENFRAIPLFVLPDLYAVTGHVAVFPTPPLTHLGGWRFENVWLNRNAP